MKIKTWIFLIAAGVLLYSPAAGRERFSLSQAVQYAKANSMKLRSADFRITGADMEVKSARADFFPRLSSGYSFNELVSERSKGPSDTDYLDQTIESLQITLTQPLYSGGRILSAYHGAQAQKQMYEAKRRMEELTIVHQVETLFFSLMKAKEDVAKAQDTVKRLESGVKAAKAYFKSQIIPLVEVLEARVNLASARQELSLVKNAVKKERSELASVLNIPFSRQVSFYGGLNYSSGIKRVDMNQAWKTALENRPDITGLEKQKQMAKNRARQAKGEYFPSVSFEAGFYRSDRDYDQLGTSFTGTYDRDQENDYWQAGISVNWKMFDAGRAFYTRKKHLNEISRLDADIQSLKNFLMSNIQRAVLQLEDAAERINTARESVGAARENYKMEKKRFEKGISTIPALLDAQARLTDVKGAYNNALFDRQIAQADLRFLMGESLPETGK